MAAVPPLCDFGWKAINATLPGVDGHDHTLFDSAGSNGLLVAFICNHCPYVVSVIERIVLDANELKNYGIGFVAISANDVESYPQDSFENMKLFAEKNHFSFPYLYNESQDIARQYDAVCTPDFFGFNNKFELQYRGRLDGSRKQTGAEDLRRDLFEAMKQIAETGIGPKDQIASMGCSIKWKEDAF
jgi:peroxiredoxin